MSPLERLRVEKAAADCGFEMSPLLLEGGLQLRSARFPEYVVVTESGDEEFAVTASNPLLLDVPKGGARTVRLQGYAALYDALSRASARGRTLPDRVAEAFRQATALLPRSTEAERLLVQRVGQDLFRAALLDYWQGKCCVTGLAVPELLRASHIKPWAQCDSDEERLDVFNGLLLAPHVDALFDGGWISFENSGQLLVSAQLTSDASSRLGISFDWRLAVLTVSHLPYLRFHRDNVLRRPTSR
jgi:putative restriction endonuclease